MGLRTPGQKQLTVPDVGLSLSLCVIWRVITACDRELCLFCGGQNVRATIKTKRQGDAKKKREQTGEGPHTKKGEPGRETEKKIQRAIFVSA